MHPRRAPGFPSKPQCTAWAAAFCRLSKLGLFRRKTPELAQSTERGRPSGALRQARAFSSEIEGEQVEDSIRIIGSYSDVIVIRHLEEGGANRAAKVSPVP